MEIISFVEKSGNKTRSLRYFSLLTLGLLSFAWVNQAMAWEFSGSVGYHSRYMLEGQDVLDGFASTSTSNSGQGGIFDLVISAKEENRIGDFTADLFLITGAQ